MSASSFLEYLFETHKSQLNKPSDYLALLCHSMLLDRKAKLRNGKAILPENWNQTDPIRLSYVSENGVEINVSVVETAGDAFISVTENKFDRLGHLEIPVDDFINMSAAGSNGSLDQSYPQLDELRQRFDDGVWSVLFPPEKKPAAKASPLQQQQQPGGHPLIAGPAYRRLPPPGGNAFDYGRSDLDPFGLGSDPLRPLGAPPRIGGGGGMLFDPRRGGGGRLGSGFDDDFERPLYPGAPPGVAPPGARIDPIMPFVPGGGGPTPGSGGSRAGRAPDPDMPAPPGWEDMYL